MSDQPMYYSLRQWAPYQGTVQVVEVAGFRAVSGDGNQWQVLARSEGIRFFTYGTWNPGGSGNLILTDRTQALIEALQQQPPLPFPAIDTLELWLLDGEQRLPLALLRSMPGDRRPFVSSELRWQAALSRGPGFVSSSILNRAGEDSMQHVPHDSILERYVSAAAGAFPSAQWFRRTPEGTGVGLVASNLPVELAERELAGECFPELLLRRDWDENMFAELVDDYHSWQAPDLLTHATISGQARDWLERKACQSAQRVYDLRKVLPSIINRDLLDVAFVEGMMRKTAAA